jgi:hypothetical protein
MLLLDTIKTPLRHTRGLLRAAFAAVHPSTKAVTAEHWRAANKIFAVLGRKNRKVLLSLPAPKGAVLITQLFSPADVALQSIMLIALRVAGYRPVLVLEARGARWRCRLYRFFGVKDFAYFEELMPRGNHPEVDALLCDISEIDEIKKIVRYGIPVGTLALSTFMRRFRSGDVNLSDLAQRESLKPFLSDSLQYADAMDELVRRWKPVSGVTVDRGYTPQGHLFHGVLKAAGTCFTLNGSHRGGALMLKRYRSENSGQHPSSLAPETWVKLKQMPWTPEHWSLLRDEIENAYETGEWYSAGGSQFRKTLVPPEQLRSLIGLDANKPTAVIFPHMFWDASFTWGRDLFANYEDWFKKVLAIACTNDRLNWIVKVHPANTTKNIRDGYKGEHSEILAIREVCGSLPKHVFLLPPESEISTLSIYRIMDYCLTVRGTPGIEAPAFGKVTLTAGTGRYDGHGFTRDSNSAQEYIARLERLHEEPPMTAKEIELARRFAFGVFMMRPITCSTLKFNFQRDAKASVASSFILPASGDIRDGNDVKAVVAWINSDATDYLDGSVILRANVRQISSPELATTPLTQMVT